MPIIPTARTIPPMNEGPSKRRPPPFDGLDVVVGDNGAGVGGLPGLVLETIGVVDDGVIVVEFVVGGETVVVVFDAGVVTGIGVDTVILLLVSATVVEAREEVTTVEGEGIDVVDDVSDPVAGDTDVSLQSVAL